MNMLSYPKPTRAGREDASTLAEIIDAIALDESLTKRRRRDIRSALSAISRVLDQPLDRIPAMWGVLHKVLGRVNPAQHDISLKRWQNVLSEVRFAIRQTHMEPTPIPKKALSIAWRKVWNRLEHQGMRHGLTRFVRFCDMAGVPPHRVDDEISAKFLEHLTEYSLALEPLVTHRKACALWNKAVNTVSRWPSRPLTVPNYRKPSWTLKPEEFPELFRKDVDAYLDWLSGRDFSTDRSPANPCKSSTIELRRRQCYQIASAAVLNGYDSKKLRRLEDLLEKDTVKRLVEHYSEKYPEHPEKRAQVLVHLLRSIARHWVQVNELQQHWFDDLLKRFKAEPIGLTEKNRETLRKFQSEENVRKLLQLPQQLTRKALRSKSSPKRVAVMIQKALAVEILLMAPMRIGNLASLHLDRHVVRPAGKSGPVYLTIESHEVKNDHPLEFELPDETKVLLQLYIDEYLPHLSDEDSQWLFPGQDGNHKWAQTLSAQLSEITEKEIGIRLTAHQFRHVAAKLLLDREPGNYEMVRRLLGHKSMRTTVQFYTGMETLAATRHYDAIILDLRNPKRSKGKYGG